MTPGSLDIPVKNPLAKKEETAWPPP